jgi:WD40 repeat protein
MIKFFFTLIIFIGIAYSNESLTVKVINKNVSKMLITPDNKKIILDTETPVGTETEVKIFDSSTLRQIFVFDNIGSFVKSMSTTDDTLTLSTRDIIFQYDLKNGKLVSKNKFDRAQNIMISPDSSIALVERNCFLRPTEECLSVWDITQHKVIDTINLMLEKQDDPSSIRFEPMFSDDSKFIIVRGSTRKQGFLALYDIKNKKEVYRDKHEITDHIFLSLDGETLFYLTYNPFLLKAVRLDDGQELISKSGNYLDLKFLSDNRFVIFEGNKINLYSYPNLEELGTFNHECTQFENERKIEIITSAGKYICTSENALLLQDIFDQNEPKKILMYQSPYRLNFDYMVSKDKNLLVTNQRGNRKPRVDVFNLYDGVKKIGTFDTLTQIHEIKADYKHNKIYAFGRGVLWIYDLINPSQSKLIETNISRPISIVTGEEKNILYIADGGYNSSVYKFDMNTSQFLGSFGLSRCTDTDVGTSIFMSLDKKKIYMRLRADNKTHEFDIHTFKKLNEYEENAIKMDGMIRLLQDERSVDVQLNPEGGIGVTKNGMKTAFYGFNSDEWIMIINDTKYLASDKSMAQYIYYKDGSPIDSSQGINTYE